MKCRNRITIECILSIEISFICIIDIQVGISQPHHAHFEIPIIFINKCVSEKKERHFSITIEIHLILHISMMKQSVIVKAIANNNLALAQQKSTTSFMTSETLFFFIRMCLIQILFMEVKQFDCGKLFSF